MIATHPTTGLVKTITACRACGSGALDEVLDLGTHAVSDFYATVPADELRAPLCLVQCGGCGLVQLTHSVSKDRLYHDYWYRSGLNPAMVAALKDVVDDATSRVALAPGDKVLDIGSNDGTLLDQYPEGLRTFGVEPSNLARLGAKKHTILSGYFPKARFGFALPPKIITSVAMFYDLDDPSSFVRAVAQDLDYSGVYVNQMMDLDGMLYANAFDNICHEHVGYWSIPDFDRIVDRHDLHIEAMSANTTNGGSLRTIVKHGRGEGRGHRPTPPDALRTFRHAIHRQREDCLAFLEDCRYNGKTVLGYGASTKGNTLLQYYGITSDLLPAIAERNPDKWGKITAGSHIPIISESEARERNPDYLFIFPWHFLENFKERERAFLERGGKFIVPLPTFRVIGL